jgi:hypothetical protein
MTVTTAKAFAVALSLILMLMAFYSSTEFVGLTPY